MRRFVIRFLPVFFLVFCAAVLPIRLVAQPSDAYAVVKRSPAISLPGYEASLMVLDNNLWVSSAGLLLRAECGQDEILALEADAVMNGIDENVVYVVRHPYTGNLFFSTRDRRGRLSLYEQIPRADKSPKIERVKVGNVKHGVTHPVFSRDGRMMVFSARLNEGAGMDIWYSWLGEDGWSNPIRMGGAVNTIGDEVSPFVWGDYLLFASRGRNGEGLSSWQVYATRLSTTPSVDSLFTLQAMGDDSEVQLLPSSVNSGLGDLDLVVDTLHRTMYWVTLRDGLPSLCAAKGIPEGFLLSGQVLSDAHRPMQGTQVEVRCGDQRLVTVATDPLGNYSVPLQAGRDYVLHVSCPACFSEDIPLVLHHNHDKLLQPLHRDVVLRKWSIDTPFRINNLFGDNADVAMRPDAERQLETVRHFLKDNPQLRATFTLHGSRTDDDYVNGLINERRLAVLRDYFSAVAPYSHYAQVDDTDDGRVDGNPLYDWLEVSFQKK